MHGKPPLHERISYAKEEEGKFGKKLVLFFESGAKLSLNATSVGILINYIGDDFDTWSGHDIEVFAGEVDTKSGRADAVLVRVVGLDTPLPLPKLPPTPTAPTSPKKPAPKAAARADMDDEIPW